MHDAETIFRAGLDRVDPLKMMERVLTLDGETLRVTTESQSFEYDLARYRRILVLGAGKASARMALGLERLLGGRIADGLVAVKEGHLELLDRIRLVEAAHPVPDERSAAAAEAVLDLAHAAGEGDLVFVLVSGGGSAILAAPRSENGRNLTLEDKQSVTRSLLACGATIQEINCVRKKLSRIKGGRLARALGRAEFLSLILSDVVGDDLDASELGYNTLLLTGEAREMPHLFLGIAKDITAHGLPVARPACVIAGGETTVTLRGGGKGGRNQEMALAYLAAYAKAPKDAGTAVFLAASTDGSDGPTDATGAFASPDILEEGRRNGLDPARFLAENDAYHYFEQLGQLLKTGPTNANVCDIKVLVVP